MGKCWTVREASGAVYHGDCAKDIIRQMIEATQLIDEDRYMDGVARRVMIQLGRPIRTSDPESFLADLSEAGVITMEEDD